MKRLTFLLFFLVVCTLGYLFAGKSKDLSILIPMRDGCELPCDLYFPNNIPGKYPCVLIRNPLGRICSHEDWLSLCDAGYTVAVQATRSCLDTSGKTFPYLSDGWPIGKANLSDGYDTIQWLAQSPYTNGRIATLGASATGITQVLLAPSNPPSLYCQYIEMAPGSLYQYAVHPGKVFRKEQVENWLKLHARKDSVIEEVKARKEYTEFWKQFNAQENADKVGCPQFYLTGWYDITLQGTIDAFLLAQNKSDVAIREKHRLIIGPWSHSRAQDNTVGQFKLAQNGNTPQHPIPFQAWFDFHLKGDNNGINKCPSIQYYVMGPFGEKTANIWRSCTDWPPEGFVRKKLYLHAENNSLQLTPGNVSVFRTIVCDPENLVPTIGGRNLFLPQGPYDVKGLKEHPDVHIFSSGIVDEDKEITGRLYGRLFITCSDGPQQVTLRLCDRYPDGKSVIIAEGASRIEKGDGKTPVPVDIDLWSTSYVFAKGHEIELYVSASNFPAYDIEFSPKEGKKNFSLYFGKDFPSFVDLPCKAFGESSVVASTSSSSD